MLDFGHGVKLRRLHDDDVDLTFKWRNDPRIFKWTRQNAPLHYGNHRRWFADQSGNPKISMFVVVDKEDKAIGVVGLTDIDLVNRHAEFSCYINPDEHGQGYGKASLRTLFDYGFKILGLNSIWGETFEGNPARKTFERIGMRCMGLRRDFYFREGKFIAALLYDIKADEWSHTDKQSLNEAAGNFDPNNPIEVKLWSSTKSSERRLSGVLLDRSPTSY